MVETAETVIVGAGPAGLAVAACLQRAGDTVVVLEQERSGVGPRWRTRYRRLHLHTAKQFSGLPHLPFPQRHPRYPSRDEVVEYLELYRAHFGIEPRFGERVRSLAQADGAWRVETARGTTLRARNVVLCTGRSDVPYRPHWPGLETFTGPVLHSADYVDGAPFRGKRVLVVGIGNSGAEIAVDLVEHGATTDVAIRSAVNVVPRDILGMPVQRSTILMSFLPVPIRDRIGRLVSRLAFGNLAAIGLPPPREGPVSQILERHRIPLIDVGTVALVRARRLGLRAGVQSFAGGAVRFSDGNEARYDAVILATGYRSAAADLTRKLAVRCDPTGCPTGLTDPAAPGLYFVGYSTPATGLLRQIAIDARRVAGLIRARRRGGGAVRERP